MHFMKLRDWIDEDKLDWEGLSLNSSAIHLLEANPDKIDWKLLSSNPNSIHLLEVNQDKIDWYLLSGNPSAIHLLEANQDEIDWCYLSANPSIFIYDYPKIKDTKTELHKDLMEELYHPKSIQKHLNMGGELEDYLC